MSRRLWSIVVFYASFGDLRLRNMQNICIFWFCSGYSGFSCCPLSRVSQSAKIWVSFGHRHLHCRWSVNQLITLLLAIPCWRDPTRSKQLFTVAILGLNALINGHPGGWPRGHTGNSAGFAGFCRQFLSREGSIAPLLHFRDKRHRERPAGFVTSPPSWKWKSWTQRPTADRGGELWARDWSSVR